jgi:hypothetical protein
MSKTGVFIGVASVAARCHGRTVPAGAASGFIGDDPVGLTRPGGRFLQIGALEEKWISRGDAAVPQRITVQFPAERDNDFYFRVSAGQRHALAL